jgi:predicted DNA-binding WGR domain protein
MRIEGGGTMSRREFQLVEGTSRKFWAIERDGAAHVVQFGRIGTAGQTQRKEFPSEAEAEASCARLIAEKVKKGYTEVGDLAEAAPSATAEPAAAAPARPKPAARGKKAAAAAETAPSAPAGAAATPTDIGPQAMACPSTDRSIDFDPEDWFWATWRPRTPRPRPEPPRFDVEDCLERFARVTRGPYAQDWRWEKARIAPVMTQEEARFWLIAIMETMRRDLAPAILAHDLRGKASAFHGDLTLDGAALILKHPMAFRHVDVLIPLLFVLFVDRSSLRDLLALVHKIQSLQQPHLIVDGLHRHVLPFLDDAEYRAMRDDLRPMLGPPSLPPDLFKTFPIEVYLAAALGLHQETAQLVRSIPDDHYGPDGCWDHNQRPQLLVFGLGDPRSVESEMRRLKLQLKLPEYVRAWIAHTEDSALDLVGANILANKNKDECAVLLEPLTRVQSRRTAPVMLELMLSSKAPGVARRWLEEHPGHAIPGLVPIAAGKGKLADAAIDYLRTQARKGHDAFLRECLADAAPEAADKVCRAVLEGAEVRLPAFDEARTPDWLRATDKVKATKATAWIAPEDLPPIVADGRSLNPAQLGAGLAALAASELGAPHPLVAALRAHADRRSLDAFAWSLFERWLADGASSKQKWAMAAIGLIGSDDAVHRLTPMIRAWPGESQHARAVFGLECLRAIGSDAALMQLSGIAQKLPFKGLKARAAELMEAIAQDRGLSRAELEDRIVPDCELDERGGRAFDFGPRQFRFALGPEMKPMVRGEDGKLRDDLPKPGAKDDPTLAPAAVEDWKRLKKQVREVARIQAERLERAMVSGRRWSPADFETILVRHPLMFHLVRLLLWGGYDEDGRLVSSFRVTEERDYADVDESPYRLDGVAKVGVVHPLHLTDQQRAAWGQIFGDYEIIPPFPQLGRSAHRLEPGRETDTDLLKGRRITVPAFAVVGILERHGWNRGIPEDGGAFHEHSKPFEGGGVTAVLQYPGIPIGYIDGWEDQELEKCFFVAGLYTPRMYPEHKNALPLGAVDPVVLSEVLGTLGVLESKGK